MVKFNRKELRDTPEGTFLYKVETVEERHRFQRYASEITHALNKRKKDGHKYQIITKSYALTDTNLEFCGWLLEIIKEEIK